MTDTLTESLQASVNFERCKVLLEDMERAKGYLELAGEAARRYSNTLRQIEDYDQAYRYGRPWTFITTKDKLILKSKSLKDVFNKCMNSYRAIVERKV